MNKKGHVLNAVLFAIGLAFVRNPTAWHGGVSDPEIILIDLIRLLPPIVLGAMLPDIDTAFGRHRKTLHNLPLLAGLVVYPLVFGNLQYVWIGVATHYVLDVFGSKRGIALFYPYPKEYGFPVGVRTSSRWTGAVTSAVTAFEIAIVALVVFVVVPNFEVELATAQQVIAGLTQ